MDTNVLLKRLQALSDKNAEIRKENAEMRKQNGELIKRIEELTVQIKVSRTLTQNDYSSDTSNYSTVSYKRKKTRTKKQPGKKSDIVLQNRYENLDQKFNTSDKRNTPVNDPEVIEMSESGENTSNKGSKKSGQQNRQKRKSSPSCHARERKMEQPQSTD